MYNRHKTDDTTNNGNNNAKELSEMVESWEERKSVENKLEENVENKKVGKTMRVSE